MIIKEKEEERQRDKKIVALTFDDGPNPVTTPQVLSILTSIMLREHSLC